MEHAATAITESRVGFAERKPGLAELYREWYKLQRRYLSRAQGDILELGSGAGFIKAVIPNALTSDVISSTGVDMCLDAFDIGDIYQGRLSNLLMVNVFHHISDSMVFLRSASSALCPGGRIVMIDPWLNFWSRICYKLVQHEPFDPKQTGWTFPSNDPLLDSNQAQAWIVFERDRAIFRKEFPEMQILTVQTLMPFSYLLSGGHSFPIGLSASPLRLLRKLERLSLDRHMGLFALLVIEKR